MGEIYPLRKGYGIVQLIDFDVAIMISHCIIIRLRNGSFIVLQTFENI